MAERGTRGPSSRGASPSGSPRRGPADDVGYAGRRLGLPERGSGSVARFGRRLGAVCVDWLLCLVIAAGLFHVPFGARGSSGLVPLAVFAVENVVLIATAGFTVGHRLFGMSVRSLHGGRPTLVQAAIRTVLLCAVVPAVIWDRDGRGMHDRGAETVLVRL